MYLQKFFLGEVSTEVAKKYFLENIAKFMPLSPIKISGNIILYGAGDMGIMGYQYFENIGIPVSYTVDKEADQKKYDEFWFEKKILSPSEVSQYDKENATILVCIANYSFSEICNELKLDGWQKIFPLYDFVENFRNRHPLSNGWFADPFSSEDIGRIILALENLGDDTSRAHHLQFLAWRCLRDDLIFQKYPIEIHNRFFINQITDALTAEEEFLDLGAHQGKVTKKFLDLVNYQYRRIWAIDGDQYSFDIFKENLEKHQNLISLNIVLAADCKELKFSDSLGYASQVSPLGSSRFTTTLDQLETSPTFIKMHLEGFELNVLQGGIKTITRFRPMMAITAYHNSDGIFKLINWLIANLENYKIFTRLHSWCGTGYVIYCVPIERL